MTAVAANLEESRSVPVISADCHAGADVLDYKPYLATEWHDEFDAWAATFHDPWVEIESATFAVGVQAAVSPLNWESEERRTRLEADGIVAELIFPNTAPPFFPAGVFAAPAP